MEIENHSLLIAVESLLQEQLHTINGKQILIDEDIAKLFEINVSQLHCKIRKNIERFPEEFMFKITPDELRKIIPRIFHRRKKIYVFTMGGIKMAAGFTNTKRAIEFHLQLIRCYGKEAFKNFDLFI